MIGPSITEKQMFIALRSFLADILPPIPIIRAQVNRAASPVGDFVMMTPLRRERLSTNIDITIDIQGQGAIAADTLTMFNIQNGTLAVGSVLFGAPGSPLITRTMVTALGTGQGGAGTYTIAPTPQTYAAAKLYAGITATTEPTQVTVQLDVFGPASAENVQRIHALLRDEYGTHFFDGLGLGLQTLFADDPRQMPFIDAENAYENRWIVEAVLQANLEVDTPMQFADSVTVTVPPGVDLIDVDVIADLVLRNPEGVPVVNPERLTILVPPGA